MDRKNKKAKETLSKLLAATAGSLLVASAAAPAAADAATRVDTAPVLERADEVRTKLAAPAVESENDAAPIQLAWWGNWHNGGWHPYWHNWPNWRNWHNWGNW